MEQKQDSRGAPTLANTIEGSVEKIGENGNLITDIAVDRIADLPADDSVKIKFGGHETSGVHPTNHDQPIGTLVALCGSSGFLEVEIVGISVAEMLGIKAGETVVVTSS